jgi:hypothetical protein
MTQEELTTIRERQNEILKFVRSSFDDEIYDLIVTDIPALLDEIDRLTAERDEWKAKAEATEKRCVEVLEVANEKIAQVDALDDELNGEKAQANTAEKWGKS